MRRTAKKWRLVASALALLTSAAAAPAAHTQPAEAAPALTPPRVTKFVEAERPDGTPAEGAAVDLELTIAADGKLTDAKVVGSAGEAIDAAALAAVRQFTFEPARRGDRAVPARIRYRYTFEPAAPPAAPESAPEPGAAGTDGSGAPTPAAPKAGRLEGRILARGGDRPGDRPIVGAIVTLLGAGGATVASALTGEDGGFAFADVAAGDYRVRVEADGFAPVEAPETVTAGEATALTYRLAPNAAKSGGYAFGATASIEAPPREVTKRTLSSEELTRTAGTRGDPVRVIELLPGVARPPFAAGLLIIRGASPFDSQVYFEGGLVDRLYHFGGLTSFTSARLIDHIDLYPGNFSVRYGRKIGGIVDIGLRDPRTDGYHGVVDVNLIDASVLAEGPVGQRGAFALSAKRSYIDFWFSSVIPKDIGITAAPVYSDYQAMYSYRPENGDKLRLLFYGSNDEFKLNFDKPADGDPAIRGGFGQKTAYDRLQGTWKHLYGANVEQEVTAIAGTLDMVIQAGDQAGYEAKGFEGTLKAEWRAQLGRHLKLIGGLDGYGLDADVTYHGPVVRATEGDPTASMSPLSGATLATFDGRFVTLRPAAYLEAIIEAGERLQLVPGVRADYFSEIHAGAVQPRLTARLKVAPGTTLKGGAGLFVQPPNYGETLAGIGNPNLGVIWAQHYGAGVEQVLGENAKLGVEGFYKRLSDLEVEGANASGQPTLVNGGRGRIYGLEVSAKLKPTARGFGFLSYTLSRSERNDHGDGWRLFDYDQTHILTVAGGYRLPRNWDLGATFRYASGNPATPILGGIYDANADFYSPVFGATNSVRNPATHQLDIRIEKGWRFKSWALATYLDLQNVYNHRSQEGLQYSYDYATSQPVLGLPILPSLGLRGEF
jgi:TonB family protein